MSDHRARNSEISYLHPTVREAVTKIIEDLNKEGIPFKVFEAFRFPERQADLYSQGRTKSGKIVTKAQPWQSFHQYGLAVDLVLFENGKWSWDDSTAAKKKWWKRMHELGEKYGLEPLSFEAPHLQIKGFALKDFRQGKYPPNGDDKWKNNLRDVIVAWKGHMKAPPIPL